MVPRLVPVIEQPESTVDPLVPVSAVPIEAGLRAALEFDVAYPEVSKERFRFETLNNAVFRRIL